MKILKVNLNNIGPYKGDNNVFDLNVSKGKNIILIGGKNGAGKTTLLNSIKIGLFGTYAYGLKTASNVYFNSLKNIFNYVESKKKISNYEISIEFSLIENYIENKYTFSRSWKKVGDDISEILRVKKNEVYLPDEEVEQIQTKLKEIMPPSVIDTMLFDGEKIAQIIDDNAISDYLREIIYVNFNLNIFDKMEDDINFYIAKEKSRNSFNADEINLLEYKNKYNENLKNLKNLKDVQEKYNKTLEEDKFKLKGLIKKFDNYGGLTDKDRFAMRSSLEILENARKENLAKIKEFLEDDIVFYLNIYIDEYCNPEIQCRQYKVGGLCPAPAGGGGGNHCRPRAPALCRQGDIPRCGRGRHHHGVPATQRHGPPHQSTAPAPAGHPPGHAADVPPLGRGRCRLPGHL